MKSSLIEILESFKVNNLRASPRDVLTKISLNPNYVLELCYEY